jgi:hypothetical protein
MTWLNKKLLLECLYELSNRNEQLRLWPSNGSDGLDVSSFIEAYEGMYGDSGLGELLKKRETGFSVKIEDALIELDESLKLINGYSNPRELIDCEGMIMVRGFASTALRLIKES